MKRFALGSIVLALAAASTVQAQYYDDRGYGYDDGYAAVYQGDGYEGGRYQEPGYGYDQAGAHYDVARVLSVDPIVQRGARPVMRQECYEAAPPAYAYDDRYGRGYDDRYRGGYARPRTSGGGAIVGAIVGGALGNTVGHGDERQVAAARSATTSSAAIARVRMRITAATRATTIATATAVTTPVMRRPACSASRSAITAPKSRSSATA
jgi:hypothetical protein